MEAPVVDDRRLAPPRPPRAHVPDGVEVRGPSVASGDAVLSSEALAFVAKLERRFGPRRRALLARRREIQSKLDLGWKPEFLPATAEIRAAEWTVAPIPDDLRDRRVEITGPVDRKMIINALNSGATVFMADFEDSCSPTWRERRRGPEEPDRRDRGHDRARVARGKGLSPGPAHRDADGAAARLAPRRRSTSSSTASRFRRASSISASSSSTTPGGCSPAAPAPTSTCRRWRTISKRVSGTTCSARRRRSWASRSGPSARPS